MIEYSLGGEGDQPECAICHIFPKNEGAARNPPPPDRGQRDLPPNQVVPPDFSQIRAMKGCQRAHIVPTMVLEGYGFR
ncbi:uncharacterized protein [Elaeis guineensis]|uniref:uncharacterized protein n=1 Tax=Elaeis guineensis var. tenera TaxID=51953 RepID=UPI003C6D53A6